MNTQSTPPTPAALLSEADARMAQALDNFFQRSHAPLQGSVLRAIAPQMTSVVIATGQTCLDWLNSRPDVLSAAFADQFRLHLARPETFTLRNDSRPAELQLLDDDALKRQLAEEKVATQLTEVLRADMLLLFGRLQAVRRAALDNPADHTKTYGPLPVIRALSRALDALGIDSRCGTLLLQCVGAPLLDTLKYTYTALYQFLGAQNVPELPLAHAAPLTRRTPSDAGQAILKHIQSVATQANETGSAGTSAATGGLTPVPSRLIDSLAGWQNRLLVAPSDAPAHILQQLQRGDHSGTDAHDLAVLDAVAGLFEFILDDPGLSPRYRTAVAQLQIPALRDALVAPDFFSAEQHPARQLIDLMGLLSRRFPEHDASHVHALEHIEAACAALHHDPGHPAEAFARAHDSLAAWLADEAARPDPGLASEVARMEHIERQELGTLLALENLQDLTERYPAPESVLRRLEAAWVPHMASLYVAESGEGPDWRTACHTLQQLFLSLQTPDSDATRESRLQSIPSINAALRRGLLAQGAEPAQLKDFFGAVTATQENWIRPALGQRERMISSFTPRRVSEQIESLAPQFTDTPGNDSALQQALQLREGDWIDFDPAYEGLTAARALWVGVNGHLLFCDSAGGRPVALGCEQIAAEMRAGRARIPEQSLTRKAMLRLKENLPASPR
ncbi:MAG TPA: DUF1631 family protein [Thiobacillus sp.]|nr:MAG: hypothetical protein B7Y27_00810 [Hydrogenophilales bacterium 16-64-40]OZA34165.1 MAG: hypothetical protein B7X82_05840 [Hydrogenophilales bacterium 17-64-65]HQS82249.1 DUF1631 family protein [Thiobacillus sp.]HQT34685.1 DUF1631 family protein [Thiobacillus sp.]